MTVLFPWFAWLSKRHFARVAARKEQERAALMRSIEHRKSKHMPFRPKQGELQRVTCEALAAECGREWGEQ
ncbi:MAG: hypothetical protein VYB05_07620 [Pseudomonadota bacterium]|nr:hypothetical protein [Pseudomonadota bacterium]